MRSPIELEKLALTAKIKLLEIVHKAEASHVGSSLSSIEIFLTCLNHSQSDNRIIISKGHAAAGFYAALNVFGILSDENLDTYGTDGSRLFGHITQDVELGITFSTGSLGHGIPYGVGCALGKKRSGKVGQVFVVASDGEMDEGTTWESALLANHHELDNLCVIVDRNGLQSIGHTEDTLRLEPLRDKWVAFGWEVIEVNGHDTKELEDAFCRKTFFPKLIIAKTTKGHGISFMENDNLWHYRAPDYEQLKIALSELSGNE